MIDILGGNSVKLHDYLLHSAIVTKIAFGFQILVFAYALQLD